MQVQTCALIFRTLGQNLSGVVFSRMRVVPRAEGRGVSLQLLDWDSRRRETSIQDGPGPNKRWPLRIKMAKGNGQTEGTGHALLSLLQPLAGGENPAVMPDTSQRRTWKI